MGIIPARAGFTRFHHFVTIDGRDHPRSRGVYRPHVQALGDGEGSSPLARGLRPPRQRVMRDAGIIPARAGFTDHVPCIQVRSGDHPRSRGVYLG